VTLVHFPALFSFYGSDVRAEHTTAWNSTMKVG
jgi:hypothetical protein